MERRLAAIVIADVVGYSKLIRDDEAGTRARFQALQSDLFEPSVATHGGRIIKTMGDAFLLEFPSAVGAVACAAELQRALAAREAGEIGDRRMRFRIGINLGDIIVEGDDIHGDGVNVAARLEELADPGGILISGKVHEEVRNRIDGLGFEPAGDQTVKNNPDPIPAYRVLLDPKAAPKVPRARVRGKAGPRQGAVVALVALAMIGGGLWLWRPWLEQAQPARPEQLAFELPDKSSIAVLPFTNLGGDPAKDYFSDGITADLITDLSRISGLFIIARGTSFALRGKSAQEIRRELGVGYVLGGSVQIAGDRVRINAQLVDTRTGGQLWADRYERDMTDIFVVQDEVVRKIVAALAIKLTADEEEQTGRMRNVDPDAYDMLLRGLERVRRYTRETNVEAREFFEKAIGLDPNYARAIANLAFTYAMDVLYGWADKPDQAIARALEISDDALALDGTVRQAHLALGVIHLFNKRLEQSIAASKRALELDPNYADAYGTLALTLNYAGRPEQALEAIQKAMRLNPLHPFVYLRIKGQAYYLMGRYDAAIAEFERVVERNPVSSAGNLFLAAAYAQVGRIEDARWTAQEILTLYPDFALARVRQREPYKKVEDLDRFIGNLRKAGLPE